MTRRPRIRSCLMSPPALRLLVDGWHDLLCNGLCRNHGEEEQLVIEEEAKARREVGGEADAVQRGVHEVEGYAPGGNIASIVDAWRRGWVEEQALHRDHGWVRKENM